VEDTINARGKSHCFEFSKRPPWKLKNHRRTWPPYMRILRHTPMVCCLLVLPSRSKIGCNKTSCQKEWFYKGQRMSVIVMSANSDEVKHRRIASSNHCMMSASHHVNVLCSDSWITHLEREATLGSNHQKSRFDTRLSQFHISPNVPSPVETNDHRPACAKTTINQT